VTFSEVHVNPTYAGIVGAADTYALTAVSA
jgi:hypothetical protein